ncbi:MAG TPA: hypothetical protein PKD92_13465 [Novosphingobium sp.]|nr:hypothetical protein [Novosphingobium sp.]HMP57562.1 hypothetical protein [Novosphingobium sp.]
MREFAACLAVGHCIFLMNDSHCQSEAINTAHAARFGQAKPDHATREVIAALQPGLGLMLWWSMLRWRKWLPE